jgi:hypothetical protein
VASLSRQATTRPSESLGTALNRIDRQMTEFATDLRRRCRNPKCRLKLPEPVSNEREAFCCRGCYRSFYRHRCLICEQPMERKTERQLVCGKRKCRNALATRCRLALQKSP